MQQYPQDYASLLQSPDYIKNVIEKYKLDDVTFNFDQNEYAPFLKDLQYNKDYTVYYKLTNKTETHNLFQYKDGLNIDSNKFKPYGNCSGGGLYFTKLDKLYQFESYGSYIRPLIVPSQVPFYHENCVRVDKYKAPIVFALPRIEMDSLESCKLLFNTNDQNKLMFIKKHKKYDDDEINESIEKYFHEKPERLKSTRYKNYKRNITNYKRNITNYKVQDLLLKNGNDELYKIINSTNFVDILYSFNQNYNPILEYMKTYYFPRLVDETKPIECYDFDEKQVISDIDDYLYENIDSYMYNIIKSLGGVVSGSTILKFISKINFNTNDIDIYIQDGCVDEYYYKQWYFENRKRNGNSYNMKNIVNVISVKNTKNPDVKIQIIFTINDPKEFIRENFDFNFCKCMYDVAQKKLHTVHRSPQDITVGRVEQQYFNNIKDRVDTRSFYRSSKTVERMIKYIKRGFIIENIDAFISFIMKEL